MAIHQADAFELAGTGDAMITRPMSPYEGVSDRFDDMVGLLRGADATVSNLEVLIHDYEDSGAKPAKSPGTYMRAPPSILDELSGIGCDMFTTATNHAFDYGHGGIESTMAALEERGLPYAGLGENRYEARRPAYFETPAGRVALLSTCTTINPGSEAGEQSEAMRGAPGINPLHLDRVYRVPEEEIEHLERISETLNIEEIKREWIERGMYGGRDWLDEEYFHFMDMKFEPVADESEAGIYDEVDGDDADAVLEWVEEADRNADYVVMGIHSHESPLGFHNKPEVPGFMREFAHDAVEAGADAFLGHGPHVLRGVEVYDGAPIFYSLGNFVDGREHIERLPPAAYAPHGIDDYTKVSKLFDARYTDDAGEQSGDFDNPHWWRTVIPRCRFEGGRLERVEIHPVSLQGDAGRPNRGTPVLAAGDETDAILDHMASLSGALDTNIEREGDVGVVEL